MNVYSGLLFLQLFYERNSRFIVFPTFRMMPTASESLGNSREPPTPPESFRKSSTTPKNSRKVPRGFKRSRELRRVPESRQEPPGALRELLKALRELPRRSENTRELPKASESAPALPSPASTHQPAVTSQPSQATIHQSAVTCDGDSRILVKGPAAGGRRPLNIYIYIYIYIYKHRYKRFFLMLQAGSL